MNDSYKNIIECPRCKIDISDNIDEEKTNELLCPKCGLSLLVRLFPKFEDTSDDFKKSDIIYSDAESSCFFHSEKAAVSHCSECGRFLCGLCEINIEDRILCPVCLERLDEEKKVKTFTNHIIFWDSVTLVLAVFPILLWPLTIITAPLTLILIIKNFNCTKNYLIKRRRWRFYLAALIATIQIIGWGVLFFYFLSSFSPI